MKNLPIRHVVHIYFPLLLNFWSTTIDGVLGETPKGLQCEAPRSKGSFAVGLGGHRAPQCRLTCTAAAASSTWLVGPVSTGLRPSTA